MTKAADMRMLSVRLPKRIVIQTKADAILRNRTLAAQVEDALFDLHELLIPENRRLLAQMKRDARKGAAA